MKTLVRFALLLAALVILHTSDGRAASQPVPVKDMVTMVDLGATSCIPCKMMAPIIEELAAEYRGKAAILFVDVCQNRRRPRHDHPCFGIVMQAVFEGEKNNCPDYYTKGLTKK